MLAISRIDYLDWQPISDFFGLWHSIHLGSGPRGNHEGLIIFQFKGHQIFLVASDSKFAKSAKSAGGGAARVFTSQDFSQNFNKSPQQLEIERKQRESLEIVAGDAGENCDTVVSNIKYLLSNINMVESVWGRMECGIQCQVLSIKCLII